MKVKTHKPKQSGRHRPNRKILAIIVMAVLVIGGVGIYTILQTHLAWALSSQANTYPFATVEGQQLGNLNAKQAATRLDKLSQDFASRKVVVSDATNQWSLKAGDLGLGLDAGAESRTLWAVNKLSAKEKLALLGAKQFAIKLAVTANAAKCTQKITALGIKDQAVRDADFQIDGGEIKLQPDQTGTHLNVAATCATVEKQIRNNQWRAEVTLDRTPANLTIANMQPQLARVISLTGTPITFNYQDYHRTLQPAELLDMLSVTKANNQVAVNWIPDRLNALAAQLAGHTDSTDAAPAVGGCDYVVSSGHHSLDRASVTRVFDNLGGTNVRSYDLTVNYAPAQIGHRSPVAPGSKVIYLTYDDGLIYGDTIMNYAACYGVKVTFFEVGSRVGADAAQLHRAIANGHSVQSHAYIHDPYSYGTGHDYAWQYNDIRTSIDAITSATGIRPTLFRPPGGNRTADTYAAAAANNISLVLWGLSSEDTAGFSSQSICNNVLARAFNGASVLMHSSLATTAGAAPCIIEGLAARGYTMAAWR